MKKAVRLVSVLLALSMMAAPLAGCKPSDTPPSETTQAEETEANTQPNETEEETTTEFSSEASSEYTEPESEPSETTEPESKPELDTEPETESTMEDETLHNHTFGKWVTLTEATCGEDGLMEHTCGACGDKETEIIPATGDHVYGEWTVTADPNCTDDGERKRSCTCGDTETEIIPAPVHAFGEWITFDYACVDEGLRVRACPCGEQETEVMEVQGHRYSSLVVPPSKTEGGYTVYTCEECGDTYTGSETPPAGSLGLAYEINSDGTTCTVTGLGECSDTQLYIPTVIDGYTVYKIGDRAFSNCTGLTEVTIPASVKRVGAQIFSGCENLHTVCFLNKTGLRCEDSFLSEPSITKVVFGGTSLPTVLKGVTNVTEVVIQDSVTSAGSSAFEGCSGLTAVHITDIEAWCKISFSTFASNPLYYAHDLYLDGVLVTQLEIPDGITSIGRFAFTGCSMSFVSIPDGVNTIGNCAFAYCSNLKEVTIPDGVTEIGGLFQYCTSLESVTLPNSLNSIGTACFASCSDLVDIVIPTGVTTIGNYAFQYCSNLRNVTFNDGLISIGISAFVYCNIKYIAIPASVTSIGNFAFGSNGLTSVTFGNADGWTATHPFDGSDPVALLASDLTNLSTAATYLGAMYSNRNWSRS